MYKVLYMELKITFSCSK